MADADAGLRIAAFQFAASGDVADNVAAVERGVVAAAGAGARLLVLQECALSGYPPLEVESVEAMDRAVLREAEGRMSELARRHDVFIAYGTTDFDGDIARNVMRVARPTGTRSACYTKRALYGWDVGNFAAGHDTGPIVVVDGFRVGMRVCWEVRFPEYFRELLAARADVVLVPLCMLGDEAPRRTVAESHLVSRAVENCFHVVSANSCSRPQGAPTAIVDAGGSVLARADWDVEGLAVATIGHIDPTFGQRGILGVARDLAG